MKYFKPFDFSQLSLTIRLLTVSDAVLATALGLFGPIFAVYLVEQIVTENALEVIGVGTAIYLLTRSLGQMPIAILIDRIKGELDDFYILLAGNTIFIIVPLLYIFVTEPWHLFIVQFVYGLGAAMVFPSWYAIFTRHVDKGKEGFEWGAYQTTVDMASAIAAPIGALIATIYGFSVVLMIAAGLGLISSVFIYSIRNDLRLAPPS